MTLFSLSLFVKLTRFIPREFTEAGMLERLNAYVENQEFCEDPIPVWPPLSASEITVGKIGASCVETCRSKGNNVFANIVSTQRNKHLLPYLFKFYKY